MTTTSTVSVNPMFDGNDIEGGPVTGSPDKAVSPYHPPVQTSSTQTKKSPATYAFLAFLGVVVIAALGVLMFTGNDADATTTTATDVPTSGMATKTPTVVAGATNAPTTDIATDAPTALAPAPEPVCEFFFPVHRDTDSFASGTGYLVNNYGNVTVTQIIERTFTKNTTLALPMETTNGNPYNLPFANVEFTAHPDTASVVTTTVTLGPGSDDLYIAEVGGLVTNLGPVSAPLVEPDNKAPYMKRVTGTTESSSLDITMGALISATAYCEATWSAAPCQADTYNMYYYAKICTKSPRTRAPTSAPSARPLVPTAKPTEAPVSNTPFISVIFTEDDTSDAVREAFNNATEKWNSIIVNTFPTIPLPAGVTDASSLGCGPYEFNAGQTAIEGLVIFASIVPIDGPKKVLGSAGPCAFGSGDGNMRPGAYQPRIGAMRFDIADMEYLQDEGQLGAVIEHEMGHVIGIGTTWHSLGLAPGPYNATNGDDPRYFGANGIEGYKLVGGEMDSVPVANTGSGGTAGGHWREKTFDDELMTGYLSSNRTELGKPISLMTVYSLRDLGYTVKPENADPYTIPSASAAQEDTPRSGGVEMINDIQRFDTVGLLSADGAPAKLINNPFASFGQH